MDLQEFLHTILPSLAPNAPWWPEAARAPWRVGCSTHRGPTRERNEDFVYACEIGPYQVIAVADGVGGEDHGQDAARFAVRGATVTACLALLREGTGADVARISLEAVEGAQEELATRTAALGFSPDSPGFRSTILVAVGDRKTVALAYLGDGAGVLRRADGAVERLLEPMRVYSPAHGRELLAGCVGPAMLGTPRVAVCGRRSGDLLLLSTDGVADITNEALWDAIAEQAHLAGGDLNAAAREVIEYLAEATVADAPLADDNLTLAILGTGTPTPSPAARRRAMSAREQEEPAIQ